MSYAALILAGGFSSRMGAFKPLLPLGGMTVVGRLIATCRRAGLQVVLVTGHRAADLKSAAAAEGVKIVENPDFAAGMFSSVQAGLRATKDGFAGTFIAPVDIPLVRDFTLQRLLQAATQNQGKIIYPVFAGRRGHPPFLPAETIPAILAWPREGDLKSALTSLPVDSLEVGVADRFIHADLDTPADYEKLKADFVRREIASAEESRAVLDCISSISAEVRSHSGKVAEVAEAIGRALQGAKIAVDLEAVFSASLVHDLAKGQPDHELAAAALLNEIGFAQTSPLVAAHTDLGGEFSALPVETKILYLADKLVSGDKIVDLEERFAASARRFAEHGVAAENIRHRLELARRVKEEVESLTGMSLEEILTGR
jgi:molybdenum cofactor cytidylyltransferase